MPRRVRCGERELPAKRRLLDQLATDLPDSAPQRNVHLGTRNHCQVVHPQGLKAEARSDCQFQPCRTRRRSQFSPHPTPVGSLPMQRCRQLQVAQRPASLAKPARVEAVGPRDAPPDLILAPRWYAVKALHVTPTAQEVRRNAVPLPGDHRDGCGGHRAATQALGPCPLQLQRPVPAAADGVGDRHNGVAAGQHAPTFVTVLEAGVGQQIRRSAAPGLAGAIAEPDLTGGAHVSHPKHRAPRHGQRFVVHRQLNQLPFLRQRH